jgi:hypothetical protein
MSRSAEELHKGSAKVAKLKALVEEVLMSIDRAVRRG